MEYYIPAKLGKIQFWIRHPIQTLYSRDSDITFEIRGIAIISNKPTNCTFRSVLCPIHAIKNSSIYLRFNGTLSLLDQKRYHGVEDVLHGFMEIHGVLGYS
jgi:hypothetical protein